MPDGSPDGEGFRGFFERVFGGKRRKPKRGDHHLRVVGYVPPDSRKVQPPEDTADHPGGGKE